MCIERERERERGGGGGGGGRYNEMNKTKIYSFNFIRPSANIVPGCRHTPQSRKRLAGGLSLMEEVVVLKMESGKVANPLAERLVEEKLPSMVKY